MVLLIYHFQVLVYIIHLNRRFFSFIWRNLISTTNNLIFIRNSIAMLNSIRLGIFYRFLIHPSGKGFVNAFP